MDWTEALKQIQEYGQAATTVPRPKLQIPSAALGLVTRFVEVCQQRGACTVNTKQFTRLLGSIEEAGKQVSAALSSFDSAAAVLAESLPFISEFLAEHEEMYGKAFTAYEKMTGKPSG